METTLFGKAQGRGVANPVTYRPLLRDDRHASRWHGEPHAVLSQVARLIDIGMESNQGDPDLWHLAHRFLSSDMPGEHLPDWAIILGFEDFQPPARLLHLSDEQWLRAKDSVKQEITLCRLEVSRRSRDCYAEWLRTSSTGSLKPLFKCIRKYEASVERPFATFSAASKLFLRAQQWTQLWHSTGTPPSQGFEELKQRARSQARELQPLDATTVERYIRKTPLKASGPDGWTPQMARALTSEQCDHLATLFRRAELTGEFPQQWSATLVILLAKNPEVERPIALMHTMLKCWMKLRWALLSAWQDTFSAQAWWDSCGPGLSCLDVAVRRLIQAGDEAPPLDLKPRQLRRGTLPPKPKTKQPTEAKMPQQHNRPAPQGGLNKKQRLELLLASEHVHGHRYAWTHSNPTNHSLKCSVCSLFIQQVHPEEVFTRLEAQHCAHRPLQDISRFGLHPTHSFYNMGAVLLCTKCFAVHKPGQLTLTKVVQEPCPGASRAHEKRRSLWAQKYLEQTTAPGTLFGAGIPKQQKVPLLGPSAQQVEAQPPSAVPTADDHTDRTQVGCGPHASPDAKKAAGASTPRTPQPVPQLPKASSLFKGPTLPASVTPTSPAGLGSKQGSQLEHLGSTRSNHHEPNLLQAHTPARPNSELFPQGKQSSTPTSSRPQVGGRREEGASPSIASYFQPCHGRGSGSSIAGSTPGRGGGYGNKRKGPAPPPTPSPSQTGSGTAQTEAQEERKTPPPKGGRTGVAGRTAGKKAGRTTSSSPAKLAGTSQNVQKKTPARPKTGQRPQSQ